MSCKLEPAIWSHETSQWIRQWIPCFDRCRLITTRMSNIRQVQGKPSVSLSTYYLAYGRHACCRHRLTYAPTSNTASHDNREKINSWVSFSFPYEYGAPLDGTSGRRSSVMNTRPLNPYCDFQRLRNSDLMANFFLTRHKHFFLCTCLLQRTGSLFGLLLCRRGALHTAGAREI